MELENTLRRLVSINRVPFVHMRNIKRTGPRSFHETAHASGCGEVDMAAVMKILIEENFDGAVRPDHGRMIWDENGKPGYGLYDRALGAMYIEGLREGISKALKGR
jgi:mannonate dehydratase